MRKEKFGIGTIHETKYNGRIKIIGKVKSNGRLRVVLFLNTNSKQEVNISGIGSGLVRDKSLESKAIKGVYGIGKIFKTDKYGEVRIVKIVSHRRRIVEFCETGTRIEVDLASIKTGRIKDRSLNKTAVGTIHDTNNCGNCEVLEIGPNGARRIKFLNSGNIKWVYAQALLTGSVLDGSLNKYVVGSEHETKKHGTVKVLRMGKNHNYRIVKFLKYGIEKEATLVQLKKGNLGLVVNLTEEQIHEICKELKYGLKRQYEIAIKYNVTSSAISVINRGKSNKHITSKYKYKYEKSIRGSIRKIDQSNEGGL